MLPASDCPPADDGRTICTTSSRIPAAVFAAVQARFPNASEYEPVEERLRDVGVGPGGLWYRAVQAAAGKRLIEVIVRRRTPNDVPPFFHGGASGPFNLVQATHLAGREAVVVAVTASRGQLPPLGLVRALARDPRLLVASGS